jgi:hydroxypyruvate isomerase
VRSTPDGPYSPGRRDLATLRDHGYDGWVALEYRPTTTTEESLAWLRRGDLEERK